MNDLVAFVWGHSTHSFFILAIVFAPTTPLSASTFSLGTLIRSAEILISIMHSRSLTELTYGTVSTLIRTIDLRLTLRNP
jgi:hypothetical protein